jgi:serine/threonine protein kinase
MDENRVGKKRRARRTGDAVRPVSPEPQRTCPSCGNEFSGSIAFCPVCMLRKALADGVESGESSFKDTVKIVPEESTHRFEHYELVTGADGKPVELGRGAMGVTYKAFDVDLHCPVTLKVISHQYLGDESARLRFLREARAAAGVRHPNVASVFHLGRTGSSYFYAMEFVEGETLQNLISRSGRLEVKLALEIVTQVAVGLAAVHKQKLVHRDIKPSNIMVSLEEGGAVTAKIIDLGLAKTVNEPGAQTAISTPGIFAGTPEFASPEQFGGVQIDIRSDLYSLGMTIWEMLAGQMPFRGTPGEVMYQHQHASLPLNLLEAVPQPVLTLLEVMLEKDPAQRFQTPTELLMAIPTITGAIDARRRITRKSLQQIPPATTRSRTRRPAPFGGLAPMDRACARHRFAETAASTKNDDATGTLHRHGRRSRSRRMCGSVTLLFHGQADDNLGGQENRKGGGHQAVHASRAATWILCALGIHLKRTCSRPLHLTNCGQKSRFATCSTWVSLSSSAFLPQRLPSHRCWADYRCNSS